MTTVTPPWLLVCPTLTMMLTIPGAMYPAGTRALT